MIKSQVGYHYEYDGLNLLRVDELYDPGGNGLSESDPWRKREVMVHRPGSISALVGKRVYGYPSIQTGAPNSIDDYTYAYDPVGNVVVVFDDNGDEAYHFAQDAFGNELAISLLDGDDWSNATSAGITEHQTGKWIDEFTGMYYFQARWYQADVGRFVGRDAIKTFFSIARSPYAFCESLPTRYHDSTGLYTVDPACTDSDMRQWLAAYGLMLAELLKHPDSFSDENLRSCLKKAFEIDNDKVTITCDSCKCTEIIKEDGSVIFTGGWATTPTVNEQEIGKLLDCKITICAKLQKKYDRTPNQVAKSILHEMGHCCQCHHKDMDNYDDPENATGKCKGIPN